MKMKVTHLFHPNHDPYSRKNILPSGHFHKKIAVLSLRKTEGKWEKYMVIGFGHKEKKKTNERTNEGHLFVAPAEANILKYVPWKYIWQKGTISWGKKFGWNREVLWEGGSTRQEPQCCLLWCGESNIMSNCHVRYSCSELEILPKR